jgi:hypothetical protein
VAVVTVIRSLIVGAIVAGSFAGPAFAQKPEKTPMQMEQEQKKKDAEAIDKQYKATLDRIKRNETQTEIRANDPWSNMRGPDDSKPKR